MHSRGSCPLEHGKPYCLLNLTQAKELVTPKGHRLCDHFDRNVSNNLLSRKLKYPKRYAKGPGGHRLVRVSQLCLPDLSPSAGSRNRQLSTLTASIGCSNHAPPLHQFDKVDHTLGHCLTSGHLISRTLCKLTCKTFITDVKLHWGQQ